jgi:hypothetical protein
VTARARQVPWPELRPEPPDLRKKGVIEIDRRRIVVLDREALRSRV